MHEEQGYWQSRSFRRRQVLRAGALAAIGAGVASLVSCRTEERTATQSQVAEKQPTRGGILNHSQNIIATPLLDPQVDSPVTAAYWRLFYQGLLGYNLRTFEVEPELAEKWEQPSQTEYILSLQPGVKWQNKPPVDGRALTMEDVVANLERVRTNNPRFTSRTLFDGVKIEAVDKSRIKLTTNGPDAAFLGKLSSDSASMLPPEILQKAGAQSEAMKGFSADLAIGTGPFIARSIEENVSAEFVRNPDYWKVGQPCLDGVRIVALIQGPGNERGWAAFLAKQVDITGVPGPEVQNYISRQGAGYSPDWAKDLALYHAAPNAKVSPFNDIRVSKALRLFIDHDEVNNSWAQTWSGRGQHGGFLAANLDLWDFSHEEYTKYLEWKSSKNDAVREGISMLDAAGFNAGNPLKVEISVSTTPSFKALGELLDGQWRRLGQGVIVPEIKILDPVAYQTARAQRAYSYIMASNSGSFFDPDGYFDQVYRSNGARNYWNWSDSRLDSLIDRQRITFDPQQRKAAVKEVLTYLIEQGPGTGLSRAYVLNGLSPQVRGFSPEVWFNGRQYENVWLEA